VKPKYHAVFQAEAMRLGVDRQVEFFGYISEVELQTLYRKAKLFVMPSLAEGFGIPLLEAMVSGVPIAASRTTSLPEICGTAALYFDPTSIEEMADCMRRILSDRRLQAELSEEGILRAKDFHPALVREKVRTLWDKVLDIGREPS
jgi:glycosyltransferase involved in cell wall biosynthesis